jgi:DNA-binding MarR family transcriptional regulator
VDTTEAPPDRLGTRASWLIGQSAVHAHRLATDAFAAAGVRGYHYRVLAALREFGPSSQAEIGRRCRMDRSDVVAAVSGLEADGSVERRTDPADRRRNTVTITRAGGTRLRRLDRALDAVQDDLLAPLSPDERQTFVALLGRLVRHHGG